MPILVARYHHDDSSDDDTADWSYVDGANIQQRGYHTDNDNNSVDNSDDESQNTISGLQDQTSDDRSSDGDSEYDHDHASDPAVQHQLVPQSIDTNPIVSEWSEDNINGD